MNDPQTDGLLRQLRSRDPREAWGRFLETYSPLLLEVVRLFEREEDDIADCYVFVCEHLCRDNFRKLTRFRPDGPARFSTWLCAVARNLCLDWHRREVGRERIFESVSRQVALTRPPDTISAANLMAWAAVVWSGVGPERCQRPTTPSLRCRPGPSRGRWRACS